MNAAQTERVEGGSPRAGSIGALPFIFIFDLLAPRDHQTDRIAGERLRLLRYSAPLLAAAHIICGGTLFRAAIANGGASFTALVMPLVTVLLLDLTFMFVVWRRSPFSRRPYLVIRATALYVVLSGVFWTLLTAPVLSEPLLVGGWLVRAAMVAGFAAAIAAFLATPALQALNLAVALTATWLSGASDESMTLVSATALCLFLYSLFSARDQMISAEKRYAAEWQSQKAQRFVAEFEQGGRGWFWETDGEGALTYISEQLAAELRKKASDLLGRPFSGLFTVAEDNSVDGPARTIAFYLGARFPFSDVVVRPSGGEAYWWSLSGSPVFDEFGQFLGFRGIGTDLTQHMKAEAATGRLGQRDSLTGLPNRATMRGRLDQVLGGTAGSGPACALLLVDLDGFAPINDRYGTASGDALLLQAAQRLTEKLGTDGQIGRAGGDRFEVVVRDAGDAERLGAIANRLLQDASLPYLIGDARIEVGASIGIAVGRPGQADADGMFRDAAFALDAAKTSGGGKWRLFAPDMRSDARERVMLQQDLKEALGRGELKLLYQPLVNSVTEDLVGFEALARWEHPTRGTILPEQFIPMAEECGLILPIGDWVLRTACEAAATWPNGISVSVNLSPIQFASPTLPATVLNALAGAQLAPGRLELEVTEAVFPADDEPVDEMFASLKAIGLRLALDDFGTGPASLGNLRKAPLDKVKIDQPLVRGAADRGSPEAQMIASVVGLAEALGMDTTAEGTETYEELALIRELGCSQVQGYIFGKPMPAEDAIRFAEVSGNADPERCRPARHSMIRTALLNWNDRSFPTRIRNISASGAMLECERGLAPGARVELEMVGYGTVAGEVRWSDGNRIGVRFDEEFELRDLATTRRTVAPIRTAPPGPLPGAADERRSAEAR